MHRRRFFAAALAAAATLAPATALAYPPPWKTSEGIPTPARSVASADDSTAVAVNPALLPLMPDAELRWQWLWTDQFGSSPNRGHAFSLAAPLWFLGTGLRLDVIDPPEFVDNSLYQEPFFWLRWGVGASLTKTLSIGGSLAWSFAPQSEPALDHLMSMSLGVVYRPSPYLSMGAVARDFNQTTDGTIKRSYDASIAVRPIEGHRRFEVGLSGTVYETSDRGRHGVDIVPGVVASLEVPRIGRLRGDLRLFDIAPKSGPSRVDAALMFGIEVNIERFELSGGFALGNALTGSSTGFYAGAAVHGFRAPGMVLGERVVKIYINETPGVRAHTRLLRRLWRMARDPEVGGVALILKAEPASSFAHAEELGDALRLLRLKGKKSLCFLEDSGGRSLYVCSQADRIAMNPAGGLRFAGLSSQYLFLGGLAEKLGIKVDFVRIGAHKTAAEEFTLTKSTKVAHDDHQELVNELEKVFLNDVGGGRHIPAGELGARLSKGPFVAKEAKAAGLVDVLAFEDELGRVTEEVMGRPIRFVEDSPVPRTPAFWGDTPKIAIVYLAGSMVDGESQSVPLVNVKLTGSATIIRALRRAREDRSVKAVVFRMETGGGSSLAADVILREAQLTAKVKPLIVSMGSAAASGGYYASLAGGPIFANRSTVTGSIGIFYGKADISNLIRMLGANVDMIRSSPRADAESLYRPFTDDEHAELGRKVKQFYETFVGRVAEGRKMSAEDVDKRARGKVWTGAQALPLKLVDRIGGLREAIAEAKQLSGAPEETAIVELPDEDDTLLGMLLKAAGITSAGKGLSGLSIPPLFMDIARAFAPFLIFDPSEPLALAEVGEEASAGGTLRAKSADDEPVALPPRGRVLEEP